MLNTVKKRLCSTLALFSILAVFSFYSSEALSRGKNDRARGGARSGRSIDVSCDFNTIRFVGPTQLDADGNSHPDYGASFVVQGVIYPGGTFDELGTSSGLLPNGDPEFPDRVIGKWVCRGWFTGDRGIFTETGPFVATTQIYDLNLEQPGAQTLISDGIELIDLNVPFRRAVTGGTGRFKSAKGQVVQTAVGANATGLFNFTFNFDINGRVIRNVMKNAN